MRGRVGLRMGRWRAQGGSLQGNVPRGERTGLGRDCDSEVGGRCNLELEEVPLITFEWH